MLLIQFINIANAYTLAKYEGVIKGGGKMKTL